MKKQNSARTRPERLRQRCGALAAIVKGVQSFYPKGEDTQKQLIETTIGAGVFYLGGKKCDLWDGLISRNALECWEETGKRQSEEHKHPRRITGRKLLQLAQDELTAENLEKLYLQEYGKFTYVTSKENNALRKYQTGDVFTCWEDACKAAGVEVLVAKTVFEKDLGPEEIMLPQLYGRLPRLVKARGSAAKSDLSNAQHGIHGQLDKSQRV